jgi:hypothetical protein
VPGVAFYVDGKTGRRSSTWAPFFWEKFFQSPQNFEESFRVFQKILTGSKTFFFPDFYDSFSMATQLVFLRKKEAQKVKSRNSWKNIKTGL